MRLKKALKNKKLIVFDLDGTLTASKSPLTQAVGKLLVQLLESRPVAIIGGGRWQQFQEQFLHKFKCPPKLLKYLYLFPTSGSIFYYYAGRWKQGYAHLLTKDQKKRTLKAFEAAFKELNYKHPAKVYGEIIQDRGTQITFSALGQDIVGMLGAKRGVAMKAAYKATGWREKIAAAVQKRLPDLAARAGGWSSVDVVKKGIDKGYGIRQIKKELKIPISDMVFIGDALQPSGNDHAARKTGVDCVQVDGPHDTKNVIRFILG